MDTTNIGNLIRNVATAGRQWSESDNVAHADRSAGVRRILADVRRVCAEGRAGEGYLSRAEALLKSFSILFPNAPDVWLLRAPGRVNLIGEHTDYNGLPVLPMAIDRDIMLVAAPRPDTTVCIHNTDTRFPHREFSISEHIEPYGGGDWGDYAKAAAQAVHLLLSNQRPQFVRGFNAVIDGNIPLAGGLASSSALVVTCAFAMLLANARNSDRLEIAELLAAGEQYVGTHGGGMDQIVCLMGREEHAVNIEFFPTRLEYVPVPADYRFVVCHSTVEAPKTTAARSAYNLRAAESRIAAAMLAKALAEKTASCGIEIRRIGDLYTDALQLSEAAINALMERAFIQERYSLDDIARALEIDMECLRRMYLDAVNEDESCLRQGLKLGNRCRHVISEGRRVRRAAAALRTGRIEEFGSLMYASHESCANDYEISTTELDTLVSMAQQAGAVGARLTGAGFGGCVIGLVRDSEVDTFITTVENDYYGDYLGMNKSHRTEGDKLADHLFACTAVRGAGTLFA